MSQLSFFDDHAVLSGLPRHLLDYHPGVFTPEESRKLLEQCILETPWVQRTAHLYGKDIVTPRLSAFYGDVQAHFSRSDQLKDPLPWTAALLGIKDRVERLSAFTFNSVLLNYYRDGNDSVSWHSDNDGIPGRNRIVASISLGQPRRFDVRNTASPDQKFSVLLENGSYLLMQGDFQDQWQHRIAKSTKPMGPRINLTFRVL